MGRQPVRVVQDRRDWQVLTAHGSVDDHLEALDCREHIHGAPIATRAIVIEDQRHVPTLSSALAAAIRLAA